MLFFSQAIVRQRLQSALLIQAIVIETQFSVVAARPYGADDVDSRIARLGGQLAGSVHQLRAQTAVLGAVDPCVLQLFHAAVHMHLADHRLICMEGKGHALGLAACRGCAACACADCAFALSAWRHRVFCLGVFAFQLSHGIRVWQGEAQEAGYPAFGGYPLQETLAGGGGFVGHHLKRKALGSNVGEAYLAVADLRGGKPFGVDALLHQLAQVHLLVAGHDVVCRDIADHTRYARERRRDQHVFG